MDTKLKNRHKLAILLIGLTIFMAAEFIVGQYSQWYFDYGRNGMEEWLFCAVLLVILSAWIYPCVPTLNTGEERIFRTPLEIVGIAFSVILHFLIDRSWSIICRNVGAATLIDHIYWCLLFFALYWISACVRLVYKLGLRRTLKERTFIGRYSDKIKNCLSCLFQLGKAFIRIDFTEKNDKAIMKLVVLNFVFLFLLCMVFGFRITVLFVYSIVMFLVLRKCYFNVQEKYAVLLSGTNEIANGNLDVTIEEDLWVLNPLKEELKHVQKGFKNAVEKEVKSQRMKTELITNVSHDLKTPLTSIVTYVDLLKTEKKEEKRQKYIEILERKAMRLKILIEDLFAISKASSNNILLNLVEVDVVNLFKQARVEMEERIREANLEFRCSYPEEKLIVMLDSQTTYRIFENLLINIAKYAMHGTRVYVDILREKDKAIIRLKNVSANELNFNPEEVTERFVRGDLSRNTEGSGLGLAIAKSFTEIQKGEFKVETEADLFKVEIRFPMR